MTGPSIISISPVSGASSVSVNTSISIIFDQEIDTFRLKNGGIIVEGPDQSKAIGPGFLDLQPPSTNEDDFLTSPGYKGLKNVSYLFSRVDGSGASIDYYDYGDTAEAGQLYRTKVTIIPKEPFAALTEYTVYIIGDEDTDDAYTFGLTTRSVFDHILGANTGNGNVSFYGGYTGSTAQQFFVEITSAGTSGTAQYEWWTNTSPIRRTATTSISYRTLRDGVKIKFYDGLQFEIGDTFSVWCQVPEYMDGSQKFSFTTSDQEATEISSSTLLTGTGSGTVSGSSASFAVSSTSPSDRESFIDPDTTSITITFSGSIDPTTITSTSISITGNPSDGLLVNGLSYTKSITYTASVSDTILTLTLDADQLYENNVIIVSLDSSISDTSGNSLSADYNFFFSTEFSPFYVGARAIRLRLGSFGNYIPEDTINFAIWEASREADVWTPSTWVSSTLFLRARYNFVLCYAAWILVTGGLGLSGNGITKKLADFSVTRNGGSGADGLDDNLRECWELNKEVIVAGGDPLYQARPKGVVKGDYCVDEPPYGRLWGETTTPIVNTKVTYSGHRRWYGSHYRRSK